MDRRRENLTPNSDLQNPTSGRELPDSPAVDADQNPENFRFPVSLAGNRDREDDHLSNVGGDNNDRRVPSEVDFFSDSKSNLLRGDGTGGDGLRVKKEEKVDRTDVNTRLNLLTTGNNTGSDQSYAEVTRAKKELAELQVTLKRVNSENSELKGMLDQLTKNFDSLFEFAYMQQHQIIPNKAIEGRPLEFIDLRDSRAVEKYLDEVSNSLLRGTKRNEREESSYTVSNKRLKPSQKYVPLHYNPQMNQTINVVGKARVAVRARSEAQVISDGCQWRKYGQKTSKGSSFPRSYYRCTMGEGCPVRKQVQRCAEDKSVLITTYESEHNHPLPHAAMAMVAATTVATNSLLSNSRFSHEIHMNPTNLQAQTGNPYSNMATLSDSGPFPTITLDLTHPLTTTTENPSMISLPQQMANVPPNLLHQIIEQSLNNQSKFSGVQFSGSATGSSVTPTPQVVANVANALAADPNFTAALTSLVSSIISGSSQSQNDKDKRQNQ